MLVLDIRAIGPFVPPHHPQLILFDDNTIFFDESTDEGGPAYRVGTLTANQSERLVRAVLATGLASVPDELDLSNNAHPQIVTIYVKQEGRWLTKSISDLFPIFADGAVSRCAPRPFVEAYNLLINFHRQAPITNRKRWRPSFIKVWLSMNLPDEKPAIEVEWPSSLPRPPKNAIDPELGGDFVLPARYTSNITRLQARIGREGVVRLGSSRFGVTYETYIPGLDQLDRPWPNHDHREPGCAADPTLKDKIRQLRK